MRKFVATVIALLLILPSAIGESIDLSLMSIAELQELQSKISDELSNRVQKTEEGIIIMYPKQEITVIDTPDYKVYFTGTGSNQGSRFDFDVVFINNSSYESHLEVNNQKMNGWNLDNKLISFLEPGEKIKDRYIVGYSQAMIEKPTEIEELMFNMFVVQKVDGHYNTVAESGIITFTFHPSFWDVNK